MKLHGSNVDTTHVTRVLQICEAREHIMQNWDYINVLCVFVHQQHLRPSSRGPSQKCFCGLSSYIITLWTAWAFSLSFVDSHAPQEHKSRKSTTDTCFLMIHVSLLRWSCIKDSWKIKVFCVAFVIGIQTHIRQECPINVGRILQLWFARMES